MLVLCGLMRLGSGEIPDSPDFVPDDRWTRMREPTPWVMQALALPLGLVVAMALPVLWMTLTPLGRAPAPSVGEIVAALVVIVPAHEALHVVMHPRTGDAILGVWPSRLLFYTHYHHPLRCRRYLAVLLMPVVALSLVPLAACAVTGTRTGYLIHPS